MTTQSRTQSRTQARTQFLTHNKVQLALHHLRDGKLRDAVDAPLVDPPVHPLVHPLLLLHGLGERSPARVPTWAAGWSGPVYALDFTGHGDSTVPRGGGYGAELLLADVDAAVAALGQVTVVGRGLGAYIALMIAGARPHEVRGAVLCDGPGLAGGAVGPTSQSFHVLPTSDAPPDPYALLELSRDLRPPDYATSFVRLAVESSDLDEPIAVAAIVHPPWLAAVVGEVGVAKLGIEDALSTFEHAVTRRQ